MPETRDWQEDWKYVEIRRHGRTLCNWLPVHTMHGIIEDDTERLAYWMQEYKKKSELYDELKEQLARINCDYHALKTNFLKLREECGAEKKRADEMKDILLDAIGTLAMRGNKEDADRIADKLRNVGADGV